MKKISRLFLLLVIWVLYLWVSYAEDWWNADYNPTALDYSCPCWLPIIAPIALFCLIWITVLAILIMPSRWIFKKAWVKPRKSLIPISNLYTLFGIATSKFLQLFSLLILIFLFWIFIYGTFIYPNTSYSNCCKGEWIIWMNLWIFVLYLCLFLFQLYSLARKFGWKIFTSILFALFFPIWVRILTFGNYEYIWDNKSSEILE